MSAAATPASSARSASRKSVAKKAAAKTKSAPAKAKAAAAKPKAAAKRAASKSAAPDELTRISGVGPKISGQLKDMGVTTFAQIAAWKKKDIESFNEQLKFKGRIEREQWVPQAKKLAKEKK